MSKKHFIIPIFVPHKGCPHDCVFCNQKKITGYEKETSAEDVSMIIEQYLATIPRENSTIEVAFYGGSFTAIPIEYQSELLGAAYVYQKLGRIHNIRLSTRPDCIDDVILKNLKSYGVTIVELGVQSMDQEVLALSNRGHSSQDVRQAVKLLKAYGFKVGVQVMVGLPGDNSQKCIETVEELITLEPDIARIYPALVIRNTEMEDMYLQGRYKPLSIEAAVEICKELLILFERNGVEVIRVGLQPTDNIELGRDVIAGPFHPAMRQLVESSIFLDMADMLVGGFNGDRQLTFAVNPKDISNFLGQKKSNVLHLKVKYKLEKMLVTQDEGLKTGTLVVKSGNFERSLSKKDYYGII